MPSWRHMSQQVWLRRLALTAIAALAGLLYAWAMGQDTLEYYYATNGVARTGAHAAPGYQRQGELAGRGLWLAVQEIADRGERPGALCLVHHQHPRAGGNGGDQRVGAPQLPIAELALLHWREPAAACAPHACLVSASGVARQRDNAVSLLLIAASPATQSTRSSSTFHSPANTPPGVSTLPISGSARSRSNQCIACPHRRDRALVRQRECLGAAFRGSHAGQLAPASPRSAWRLTASAFDTPFESARVQEAWLAAWGSSWPRADRGPRMAGHRERSPLPDGGAERGAAVIDHL